jgi:hypothetical protein
MFESILLGVLSIWSGFVYIITGFGSAISYLSFWFVFMDFGVLKHTVTFLQIEIDITGKRQQVLFFSLNLLQKKYQG